MAQQNTKVVKSSINHESPIITSDTNNELKKRIKDISQEVLKRNYELYKALENKWVHKIFNSPYKTSVNSTHN